MHNAIHTRHSTTDRSEFFGLPNVIHIRYVAQEPPVEVAYHVGVQLALVVSFHLSNIFAGPFSILITDFSEEVKCGNEESEF